jgi:hypothetical protein
VAHCINNKQLCILDYRGVLAKAEEKMHLARSDVSRAARNLEIKISKKERQL